VLRGGCYDLTVSTKEAKFGSYLNFDSAPSIILFDCFIDYESWNEKPFARDYWVSKTVFNLNIETGRIEYPVDYTNNRHSRK
jgi:hypothetical protein